MADEWISAAEAFKLVSAVTGISETARAICTRAHAGLIPARAATFIMDKQRRDNFDIPKEFWWACGEAALDQHWQTGDFETWIDQEIHLKAFGVSFSRSGIEALIGPAVGSRDASLDSTAGPGGRPRAEWWDNLWIEMCRQLYAGDLKPSKQAHIEEAMMRWATVHGYDPGVSTIRPRARKLWAALNKEDEN